MPNSGLQGKSWNFYNAATGKWEQVWMGARGGVLKLEGEFKDGAMRYTGTEFEKHRWSRRCRPVSGANCSIT
jgi:hypothetical protein